MGKRQNIIIATIVCGGAALIYGQQWPVASEEIVTTNQPSSPALTANTSSVGANVAPSRRAYIDPVTGELTSKAPVGAQNLPQGALIHSNLPPVTFLTHANGMMEAQLNGRHRSTLMATVDCNGKVQMKHSDEPIAGGAGQQAIMPCEQQGGSR